MRLPVDDQMAAMATWFVLELGRRASHLPLITPRFERFDQDLEHGGQTTVTACRGKGGKARTMVVDPDRAADVVKLKAGRADEERVFARIPRHLDVHAHGRAFAQKRYLRQASNQTLSPAEKDRLSPNDYDGPATQQVTEALGHHRRSVVLYHYLR